ncbi:hypothetical protein [Clostridium algidicarnis]|uniref:hypothetical protein n=1 Tax=Clostridium algidicarnis TaxID=37659 RepID=UPI001C0B4CC8|nr:hypothetical protein [Clostridium algidicarnis]MBU3205176.1 hypothetical protein [Clostridium algidicarnis]MBU3213329.1 hypothetical protein [Clostridium algidicarnis]MBU3223776.1 hypothetical protein [Clostridium algidicarnis]
MIKDFGLKLDFSEEAMAQVDAIERADGNIQIDLETIRVTLNTTQTEKLSSKLYDLIYDEPTWVELDNENTELRYKIEELQEDLEQYKEALITERVQRIV